MHVSCFNTCKKEFRSYVVDSFGVRPFLLCVCSIWLGPIWWECSLVKTGDNKVFFPFHSIIDQAFNSFKNSSKWW